MRLHAKVGALLAVALVAVGSLVAATPAQADHNLQHPRQAFLRNSVGGLFLYWGMRTAPAHTSCSAWESAVTSGGWSANYWVQEARKLHVQYIVLATFHSRLGYARPWPSSIPGTCRTNRDFVRELINATNAAGMKTILYMTDDPQWWNEGLGSGQSWMNSDAYSDYKGHDVDLHTREGFGEFSYDNFFEVMNRYPDLGGFWIDNDNAYWESRNLYLQVHQQRPNYTISNNNEDTHEMDMISNEQKTGMTPNYDYPQAVFTAQPRMTEADFKLPTSGAWWYTGSDQAVDYKLTLGRLITNAGSSVKALMAETPMKAGRMPPAQETFNNFANTYLNNIWESLNGTEGGGYMYGGLDPGFWNDGAHGVTTIGKTNPNQHYIHVINRPSGSTLRLRDNAYKIASVTNLRTGAAVNFTQSGGWLTLNGISSWDPYDTVFKVISSGREGIIPQSTYTMSASSSASGRPASAAADGNYLTYWDNNNAGTVSLRFDLGSAKPIQYVGINQREDSTTYPATNSATTRAWAGSRTSPTRTSRPPGRAATTSRRRSGAKTVPPIESATSRSPMWTSRCRVATRACRRACPATTRTTTIQIRLVPVPRTAGTSTTRTTSSSSTARSSSTATTAVRRSSPTPAARSSSTTSPMNAAPITRPTSCSSR